MKELYYWSILLLLGFTGCDRERNENPALSDEGSITVVFHAGNEFVTRTQLNDSGNSQHVKDIWLYVFDTNEKCIAAHNINWTQSTGETALQTYSLQGLTSGEKYTLLAVGLDNKAGMTYNLPAAIVPGITTLTALKAVLADQLSSSDIATSELYAGWEEATVGITPIVTINLYRRVAGIVGYFGNIPDGITAIRVQLYKNQYKDVLLKKHSTDMPPKTMITVIYLWKIALFC